MRHELGFAFLGETPLPREHERDEQQGDELRRERLRARDADLRSRLRHHDEIGLAHHRALRAVADREHADVIGLPRHAQRLERIGRLAGLRNRDEQRARQHDRVAVAVFARDLDLTREARQRFDPVLGHPAGVVGRAAGNDVQIPNLLEQPLRAGAERVGHDAVIGDASVEGVGDRARLLENLLEHEVAVGFLVDRIGTPLGLVNGPLDLLSLGIKDPDRVAPDIRKVALFEMDEAPCHGQERRHAARDEVLPEAETDDEGACDAGRDDSVGVFGVDYGERVGAGETLCRLTHGLEEIASLLEFFADQVSGDLGVGLGLELAAA